ncbi:ComEC/Rec2 family competence protein [Nitrosophilus labii]|uniref:ComEC/Rec2 family competence protein n=1 Tax=Nitrosophilus labii TaxID=2706014 RepID=UPI001656AE24|nr:ComEC/Rec2 family competence protein [Nitrosophilus labii]
MNDFKVPLFMSHKERLYAFIALFLIFMLNLSFEYYKYKKIASSKYFTTVAEVLNQYKKKNYYVLKLKSEDGFTFYTTSKEDLKDLRGRRVEVLLIKTRFKKNFFDFLKGFYTVSYIKGVLPDTSIKNRVSKVISLQHENSLSKELYNALFLAEPISKELREKLSFLGLSHLVAISGFHLGLIAAVIFFIFYLFYKPLHQRFFPYRNRVFDAMVVVSLVTLSYLIFLGEVPSLIRAYVMMVFGFFLFFRNIEILSFETLLWAVLVILALFPNLFFSVGFWLSVSGVFYIYLFLHYFKGLNKWLIFILLNFWVFFAMIPVVHYFFSNFSYMQFFSPFISMIFTFFYPLFVVLHIVGFGGALDQYLLKFFSMDFAKFHFETPFWFLLFYILISILSIYKKRIFYLFIFVNISFFIYQIAKLQTV